MQGNVVDLLNSEEVIVQFKVDDVSKAIELLKQSEFNSNEITNNDSNLLIHTKVEAIAIINNLFCSNTINVSSIETKRKLEDYFLRLINT